MTRISATRKPKYNIVIVSEICDKNMYILHTIQSALLAMKVIIFNYQGWPLPRPIAVFWCHVNCFLVFAITDVRLRRVHNMNSIVDVEAIVFVRYEGVRSDILFNT